MKKYNFAFIISVVFTAIFAYFALTTPSAVIEHIDFLLNRFLGASYDAAVLVYNLILYILSPLCISLSGCLGAKSPKIGILRCLIIITFIEVFAYRVQGVISPVRILIAYGVVLSVCGVMSKTKAQCNAGC